MSELRSGDPCPVRGCEGRMATRSSCKSPCGQFYHRYLRCNKCGKSRTVLIPTGLVRVGGNHTMKMCC